MDSSVGRLGKTPLILKLDTALKRVINLTLRLLYSWLHWPLQGIASDPEPVRPSGEVFLCPTYPDHSHSQSLSHI